MIKYYLIICILLKSFVLLSQKAPEQEENIPFLVTFGADAEIDWGDDDFCQVFFVKIPEGYKRPFYIKIFDPDTGGKHDEMKLNFNTVINFAVYGGDKCWSETDAQGVDPVGNYRSGMLLESKSFGDDEKYDDSWYVFGPFNPLQGEYSEKSGGYIFKIIAEGVSGDDGNLYTYSLTSDDEEDIPIEGANLFTYEYTFRLSNDEENVSQIFPFVDENTISVKILNFDWDADGYIRIVSIAKNGILCDVSGEGEWSENIFPIIEEEKQSSLQIQFVKNRTELIKNNNVVLVIQNQYGETLPFYVVPIGGIPTYNPKFKMISID